jgi:DNA-binding CsgD family transcriptional regulator
MSAPSPRTLAGRDHELTALRARLAATVGGQGSLVLVSGEAGIGKTTLAQFLCHEARDAGALVLVGRCYDLAETPPYGPWLELFAAYHPTGDLLPPAPLRDPDALATVTSQDALFRQTRDFLAALAALRPVVLLLDDLQWADPASLDLLRFLSHSVAPLPLLLLTTFREDELTRRDPLFHLLPTLVRESAARIALRRIAPADMRGLLDARYALPEPDATRLTTDLHTRSDGNPFFIGELLHTLEAERVLHETAEGWRLGDLTTIRVPTLLRQVIEGRLARLDEETRRLLAIAAVIGQEVPLDLWTTVAEVDEEDLLAAVEQGMEARLLVEVANDDRIQFVHALLREALYEGIAGMRRRRIHRRVAETLAVARAPDPDAAAYHFLQARDDRAAQWLVVAGTRARHTNAIVTAIDRYERALAVMAQDETARDERGWVAYLLAVVYYYTAPTRAIALLTTVINDAAALGDRTLEAIARFQRGLIRSDSYEPNALDEMAAAVRVLDAQPPSEIARIRHYLDPRYSPDDDRAAVARELAFVGRFVEAIPLAERLVADGQDPLGQPYADGAWTLGLRATVRGESTAARHWLALAHTAYRGIAMEIPALAIIADEIVAHLAFAADEPNALTRLEAEAEQVNATVREWGFTHYADIVTLPLRIARGEWREIEQRLLRVVGANAGFLYFAPERFLPPIARYRGERAAVERYVAACLHMGAHTEPGHERYITGTALQRVSAGAALDAGDLATAKAWLEAHDRWLAWADAILGRSEGQALWAQYYRQAGDGEKAYECAERAFAAATEPRQPLALLAAHRLLGELDTDAGKYREADIHLAAALALADACTARYERALTLLAMAQLRAATGAHDAAHSLLAEVRTICEPLGAQPALDRADALAARLASQLTATSSYPAGLSAREVEVLRLVAQGLTNPQAAEALFLSPRTVQQHLRSIYNKVGVSTRAAAARWAAEQSLA